MRAEQTVSSDFDRMVDDLLRLSGYTQAQLADRLGVTQSTISRWKKGAVPDTTQAGRIIDMYSKLRLDAGAYTGVSLDSSTVLRVMGKVVAKGLILPSKDKISPDGLFEIETDYGLPANAQAFIVDDGDMWPRCAKDDILICCQHATSLGEPIGWEAVVTLKDGSRYFRIVRAGSRAGVYDLESHVGPMMRDVDATSIMKLDMILQAGAWRLLHRAAKVRSIRRQLQLK